ncbi:MAG: hypothetical protein AB7V08_08765 [Elusimicrobiales bacterium]
MYKTVRPIINPQVRALCVKPYPLHPHGCPNFGKKPGCPPAAPLLSEVLDLTKPTWVIWSFFDFAGHVKKMKALHPAWSERQLACCLYWQPRARQNLAAAVQEFIRACPHQTVKILMCPEACGVDITSTMACIGVTLEWPPQNITHQVALAGIPHAAKDVAAWSKK